MLIDMVCIKQIWNTNSNYKTYIINCINGFTNIINKNCIMIKECNKKYNCIIYAVITDITRNNIIAFYTDLTGKAVLAFFVLHETFYSSNISKNYLLICHI